LVVERLGLTGSEYSKLLRNSGTFKPLSIFTTGEYKVSYTKLHLSNISKSRETPYLNTRKCFRRPVTHRENTWDAEGVNVILLTNWKHVNENWYTDTLIWSGFELNHLIFQVLLRGALISLLEK
jgi:hypothetical protein